jgi:hypothetical protein
VLDHPPAFAGVDPTYAADIVGERKAGATLWR